MSDFSFSLKQIQKLEQLFPFSNLPGPLNIRVEEDKISIKELVNNQIDATFELVVFADLAVKHFSALLEKTTTGDCTLVAVNQRTDKLSYRFSIPLTNEETYPAIRKEISDYAKQHEFEAALLHNAPSLAKPGLLLMDMDSTTIEIECIDEIAKLAGVGEQVSEVTELAMQGKLDFAESLRARVATLEGAPESILAEVGDKLPLMPGLTTLVEELHNNNWKVAVASGGFTYFTEILRAQLNLDATQANVLEIVDGKLTGKVLGEITDAQKKAETLLALAKEFNLENGQTVAMGDGANDLTMMAASHLGVAYKAKPIVRQEAQSSINYSGLDCLLHWLK